MNRTSYIKIALFFIILGGAGACYVIISANGINSFTTNSYEAVLNDASGLSTRSKVYMAGVEVGKVQGIQLNGTEARLRFVVFKDVELHQDAAIGRRASSLLGTSVLNLEPGSAHAPILPPGSLVSTVPQGGDMNDALNLVQGMGGEINILLEEFRANQMTLLAVSLETINSIVKKYDDQAEAQLEYLARILESAALISESAVKLMAEGGGDVGGSIVDVREALANIRSLTEDVTSGRGNIGMALYDERLYDNILSTVGKTEEAAERLSGALADFSALVKSADELIGNTDEIVTKAMGLDFQLDTNARYDFLSKTARASASIRLDPASNDRWYRIGVTTVPGGIPNRTVRETVDQAGNTLGWEETIETRFSMAVDVEVARRFGFLTLRGGVFENTAGVGIDVQPIKWLSISGELFQFSDGAPPNLRGALTFYPFFDPNSNMPWNWLYLRGGINNALSGDRDFFLGGGLRFADPEVRGLVGLIPAFN